MFIDDIRNKSRSNKYGRLENAIEKSKNQIRIRAQEANTDATLTNKDLTGWLELSYESIIGLYNALRDEGFFVEFRGDNDLFISWENNEDIGELNGKDK